MQIYTFYFNIYYMHYIKIFETYKAQKEIEKLTDKILQKIAEKSYEYNYSQFGKEMNLSGEFWKKPDFIGYKLVNKKIRFKESIPGFTEHGLYLISYADDKTFRVGGYDEVFNYSDVNIIWDEKNKETFNGQFLGVSIDEIENEYTELSTFIKEFPLYIDCKFKNLNSNSTKGYFQPKGTISGIIVINIPSYVKKSITEETKKSGELTKDILYFQLYLKGYQTLLHELQHAYDYYRSNGRAMDSQFSDDKYSNDLRKREELYQNKKNPTLDYNPNKDLTEEELEFVNDLTKKYLNFPHEVNARFTQALKDVSIWNIDIDMEKDKFVYTIQDINSAFKDFKNKMQGWNALTPEHKKALSRRFASFWHFEKEFTDEKNRLGNK